MALINQDVPRGRRRGVAPPCPTKTLVIRNAEGEIRWMEIRDRLRQLTSNGTTPITQIPFDGERFDVMAVRRWRKRLIKTDP